MKDMRRIGFTCDVCGRKGTVTLGHYDRFRCECGKAYWALQPARGGELMAFPWPGTPAMARYKSEQATTARA